MDNQKNIIEQTYQDKENVDVFDSARERFAFQRYKHKIESEFLIDTIYMAGVDKVKVLDVACGTGRMFREIADMDVDNVEYYGVDTSDEMMDHLISIADEKECSANLSVGDATNLPYEDDTFDVVFSFHLTWHLPQSTQLEILSEMQRVCKPGGQIVFDILNENFIWERVKHLFGKTKLPDIYKMKPEHVEAQFVNYEVEKLNDFPVKNSLLYSGCNIVNKCRQILPKNMFHMLFYRVQV